MAVTLTYVIPIIITLALLIFWRYFTVWESVFPPKFPSRFHIILLFLVSLIPGVNFFSTGILIIVYLCNRLMGDIVIKPTNFSKFWFDIEKEEKDNEK